MIKRAIQLGMAAFAISCGAQGPTNAGSIEFGGILRPYYEAAIANLECDSWQNVTIPVLGQQDQFLSFQYGLCNPEANGEMIDFSFKSKVFFLEDYVYGKYRIATPEPAFKLNPNAEKYTYLDIPIIGITKIGEASGAQYLRDRKTFHNVDWSVCQIKKYGDHIWALENPAFREVPDENYTIDKYASFKEWKLNHEEDKVKFNQKYGAQQQLNRACANEQHYWYVAKDGILITLLNPTNLNGGVNPVTITYRHKG